MGSPGHLIGRVVDPLARTDPGFARLLSAVRAVVGVVAVMGAETLLVTATGALQVKVGPGVSAAQATVQHHQILIIAILLNGVIAMVSGLSVNDTTLSQQAINVGLMPVFVIPALTIGLAIGGYRAWALASFPVVLAIGGYCRRFGPCATTAGTLLFMGEFIGFLLHGAVPLSGIGWLAAQVGVATVVLVALRVVIFRPDQQRTLRWLRRSLQTRTARVAELALAYLAAPNATNDRRLARQLAQLNEAALLIDAQLPANAVLLHQRLFDMELAVANMARFTQFMADGDLPGRAREAVRSALAALRDNDLLGIERAAGEVVEVLKMSRTRGFDRIVPRRFATSLRVYAEARGEWQRLDWATGDGTFASMVTVNSGWLPGSATVSNQAADAESSSLGRLRLPLYVRTAIQTAVAVGAAVIVGDAISPRRFYWAVLAASVAFVGTNYVAEQVRKAIHRVAGTLAGVIAGSALVRLIGHHTTASLAVALIAIFFGVYLFRISYAFMVVGITIAISQVYVELDEYSLHLLLVRLAETAVGSALALAVVVFVFPLRRSQVLQVALANELGAINHLVSDVAGRLADPHAAGQLRNDGRELDGADHALISTLAPMRWAVLGDINKRLAAILNTSAAARNYSRNLVADANAAPPLDGAAADDLFLAVTALTNSLDALTAAARGEPGQTYVRGGALIEAVRADVSLEPSDPRLLALRDLGLLDSALAALAPHLGCSVVALDTGEAPDAVAARRSAPPAGSAPSARPNPSAPLS